MSLRIAIGNYAHDSTIETPDELLNRYHALTGWADCLVRGGAEVRVFQNFRFDADREWHSIPFQFVRDANRFSGKPFYIAPRLNAAIQLSNSDVVHINGLRLALPASRLKCRMDRAAFVVQDHAGTPPRNLILKRLLRNALAKMDAVTFTMRRQADPWIQAGVLQHHANIIEVMSCSSELRPIEREAARARTGLSGEPLCLWVGRLDSNKDPLTLLAAFADAAQNTPTARLAMIYTDCPLIDEARRRVAEDSRLRSRVEFHGSRPRSDMAAYYSSADLFLLGSHHEGSGYALTEALSCGLWPVVTDIPSFRQITGTFRVGHAFCPGDPESARFALSEALASWTLGRRSEVLADFENRMSPSAVGKAAVRFYRDLWEQKTGAHRARHPRRV